MILYKRIIIFILYFLILLFANNCKPSFECLSGNCYNGVGKIKFQDGTKYEGQFKDGKIYGFGRFYNTEGDFYEGSLRDGVKEGSGIYFYKDGTKYEGSFKDNKKFGVGKFYYNDGTTLLCKWENELPNGEGIFTLSNGTELKGEYKNGFIYNGKGMKIYPNNSKYIGEWYKGKRHGVGEMIGEDGVVLISGLWRDDEFLKELK
ncbi:MAG: hypothetical protein KDK36_20375 [Leptospiraceae bacterium]|nr:hypothetical protein [Leptospiraceae bacterium]